MKALLRFEFRKLFQNKAFYICLGISLFLLIINAITAKAMAEIMKETMEDLGQPYESAYSGLSLLKSVFSNNTSIIEGVLITIIVCEDFVGDIVKNIYSKGYNRTQVYFSKLISSLTAFTAIIVVGMIVSFITGLALFGKVGSPDKSYIPSIICIFLLSWAYFSIYFGLAMLFKKIAPSIILCIIGPTAVSLLLAMADAFINKEGEIVLSDYWISSQMSYQSLSVVENKTIFTSIVLSISLIALFITLSFFLNEKRDVK